MFEIMGLMKYEDVLSILVKVQLTKPVSDENITVIDTDFSHIPVRLYLPKRKLERKRPAVIFIHGGIFVFGSCSKYISDMCVVHIYIYTHIYSKKCCVLTECCPYNVDLGNMYFLADIH